MTYTVLIIDDDTDLAAITRDTLEAYGYRVTIAETSARAFAILTKEKFHIILLDINLPDESGFEVCRELRRVSKVPVIFASARTSEQDKITGLDIGGDDYLAKPYSLKELLSRMNALLRRTYGAGGPEEVYRIGAYGEIEVYTGLRKVTRNGTELKLALKEFDVLNYLCHHSNQVVKKEEMLHEVWGVFSEAEIATVSVHIRWLREKLEADPAKPQIIKTVWGVGYELVMGEQMEGQQ